MKQEILAIIQEILGQDLPIELSVPEEPIFGHYSTNVAMRMASARSGSASGGKAQGKKPMALAEEFAAQLMSKAPAGFFEKVEAVAPGFVNFWLSKETIQKEFGSVAGEKEYGRSDIGNGKKIIVEFSSVNIAKPFHLGHFRNTIIGDAISNIFAFLGYEVIRWNYFGDWGTQFGKLIVAYRLWGKPEDIERDPIIELQKLYVRFHEDAKTNPELNESARKEFKKLEEGDGENKKLWDWFREESLKEFYRTYDLLGVKFDVWIGESFFNPEMNGIVEELMEKKIAERSEGAVVVKFPGDVPPPALVQKSDGASLYLTRDIANLRYRLKTYHPVKIFYVIGNEQSLYFEQLFAVAKMLGLDEADLKHLKYGLVLGESGKKLSTRTGDLVFAHDVIRKAMALMRQIVEDKSRDLTSEEKDEVAQAVGIGALKYNDLKENRTTDIVFDWDRMLSFVGDSGPYVQYTYARLKSIERKAKVESRRPESFGLLNTEPELSLMRKIFEFPEIVVRAGESLSTSILATYLYKLAVAANKFYETTPILSDENTKRRDARLLLAEVAARTLAAGLGLLGITVLEKI